ncbi:hypothetical protein [Flavobacterium dankookense]|uniref:Uncharacterized protein n=1 Tax=Flavobacterium dankookense TaxID=706186 RepID=A0A4R6QFC8_9FLAO|nr:hypothetical protein [Flavobacterium dankookense]TDP61175.1 hypothetical protein BC748_0789 [Flavobacterium dankookense]
MEIKIIDYLKSNSRNKIVIHRNPIDILNPIDIGLELAKQIEVLTNDNRFTLKAKSILDELISHSIYRNHQFGDTISIKNVGILFEPSLKFDFYSFIDNLSKTNCLFIQWDGETDKENLYFLTKSNGIKINIKNLSNIQYEI